jgi:hypothetical protein
LGESPLEGYPSHPSPHRIENSLAEKAQMQDADVKSRRGIGTRRIGRGGRGEIRKTQRLINGSTFRRRISNKNTFLLLIALTKNAYVLLASLARKNHVLYSEGRAYKREPELAASPQSTTLHSTGNTSEKNGVTRTKLATATHVE